VQHWWYRANENRVGLAETRSLLTQDGFLCRSAFNIDRAIIANVGEVRAGDVLHVDYVPQNQQPLYLGAFEVLDQVGQESGKPYAARVKGTCLDVVTDPNFEGRLLGLGGGAPGAPGYGYDPVVGRLTGWRVQHANTPRPHVPPHFYSETPGLRRL
jgi:hypothetical protein